MPEMGRDLAHNRVDDEPCGCGGEQSQQDEREDEESSLCARLLRWLGDAKGINKRVGEEVEKAHTVYYALSQSLIRMG